MSAEQSRPVVADKNRYYPHLLPDDITIWERFLNLHPHDYTRIEYDVRVGEGRDPGDAFPDNIRKMGLDISMRRIDAVGHAPDRIDVIEITRTAGLTSIGQLTAYPKLYRDKFRPTLPLRAVLVAEELQTDIQPVLDTLPITIYLV